MLLLTWGRKAKSYSLMVAFIEEVMSVNRALSDEVTVLRNLLYVKSQEEKNVNTN